MLIVAMHLQSQESSFYLQQISRTWLAMPNSDILVGRQLLMRTYGMWGFRGIGYRRCSLGSGTVEASRAAYSRKRDLDR
ncbi:hypothetical protein ATC00_18115 [Sinorhizobium americanum]|nr:hypothetical protein ATC00_18115 [Sinorhizobium americanum]